MGEENLAINRFFLNVNGRRVHGEYGGVTGNKGAETISDRPTLLLIHGAGGSTMAWRGQIGPLGRTMNVAAVDLPGHGRSDGPALESVPAMAAWLVDTISALSLPGPPVLAGASLGGAVALQTALNNPQSVSGLVLIATGPVLPHASVLMEAVLKDRQAAYDRFAHAIFGKGANPAAIRHTQKLLAEIPVDTLAADLKAGSAFDARSDISLIGLPTLVVLGSQDVIVPPAVSRELAEKIPGAELVEFENTGHMVHLENFSEMNRAIAEFISRAIF